MGTEVDAQTVRDATEARITAEQAAEQAQKAEWDAEAARSRMEGFESELAALRERQDDVEVVTAGVIAYLAEEEQQPAQPEHTEVEPRQDAEPKDRPPSDHQSERYCGTLW